MENDHSIQDGLVTSDYDNSESTTTSTSTEYADTSAVTISSQKRCCRFPVSPWPVYIASTLFFIPTSINMTSIDALLYNKLCYQHFHNLSLCSNRNFTRSHPDLQDEQAVWANYVSLLQIPFAILTNLILSSYCDKVGHKLPMVLPIVGSVSASLYLALIATTEYLSWPMATVLVYPILNTILGGFPLVIVAEFSYTALVTTVEKRAFNMAIAEATIVIGLLIGTTINGFIIDDFGLDKLAYVTAGLSTLPLFVSLIFMTDIVDLTHSVNWRSIVGFDHLLGAFRTLYKKRPGYSRLLLNLTFVMYGFLYVSTNFFTSGSFLYFVKERGLTMSEYSLFTGFINLMRGVGGPALIYVVNKLFRPDEFHFAMGCAVSAVFGYIIMSIDIFPHSMWVGGVFLSTITTYYSIIRANQTRICSRQEVGKMFAFDALMQVIMGNVTNSLTKEIYAQSLLFWPGLFLAISAFLNICGMASINVFTYFSDKHNVNMINP